VIYEALSFSDVSVHSDIQTNSPSSPLEIPWSSESEDSDKLAKDFDAKDFNLPISFSLTSVELIKKFESYPNIIVPNPIIKIIVPPPELS
jgi:hypothetical protein